MADVPQVCQLVIDQGTVPELHALAVATLRILTAIERHGSSARKRGDAQDLAADLDSAWNPFAARVGVAVLVRSISLDQGQKVCTAITRAWELSKGEPSNVIIIERNTLQSIANGIWSRFVQPEPKKARPSVGAIVFGAGLLIASALLLIIPAYVMKPR